MSLFRLLVRMMFGEITYYFKSGVLYAIECVEGKGGFNGFDNFSRTIVGKYGEPSYKGSGYTIWTTEDTEIKLSSSYPHKLKLSFRQLPSDQRVRKLKDF